MSGAVKIYPDKETALNRFRVQPPQPCEMSFTQYIARNSLMPVDGGWTWKFDEDLLTSLMTLNGNLRNFRLSPRH